MKLSVIIPAYNAEKHLDACLRSATAALDEDMELIVVDDASFDNTVFVASKYPCKVVQLQERSGAGKARNEGAVRAKGEFLLFLDSDVIVKAETFEKLLAVFDKRPEISAVSAIYSNQAYLSGLFQSFKAIEETYKYQAYISDRYNSFDPHCACIRSAVFLKMGGFVESYKGAEVEDVEFGYRLAAGKYINCIEPSVAVRHIYAPFLKSWWNYCRRSFSWMHLFLKRRRFDQAVTTGTNALSVFFAGCALLSLLSTFFWKPALIAYIFFVTAFMIWNIRFFYLVLKDEKYAFVKCMPFFLYMLTLQWAVAIGAFSGLCYWSVFSRKNDRRDKPLKELTKKEEMVLIP